jgi:hypothetical protein
MGGGSGMGGSGMGGDDTTSGMGGGSGGGDYGSGACSLASTCVSPALVYML